MKKANKTIYLNIGGFNIKVNFKPAKNKYFQKKLISEIFNEYQGFILYKLPKIIDYSIDILDKQHHGIYVKKIDNKNIKFVYLSEEKENHSKTTTYYYIGITLFSHVVANVLEKLLSKHVGFFIHASAIKYDNNKAILFLGPAGAGKSTVITLLKDKYTPLADDTVILKKEGRTFYIYQTPFVEKNSWVIKRRGRYEIKRICFLKKSLSFKFDKIVEGDYITTNLLKQLVMDKKIVKNHMKFFLEFINKFNEFYTLHFGINRENILKLFSNI